MNDSSDISLPTIDLAAYTWRSIEQDDITALQNMLVEASEADKNEATASEERIRQLLDMLGEQRDSNTLVAVIADGTIVAAAMIFMPPGEDTHVAMMEGMVHVDYRGLGMGSYLLAWGETRARQEFAASEDEWPQVLRIGCTREQVDRIKLFEHRGFSAVRYSYKMRRSLMDPIQKRPLPKGLQWVQWTQALDTPLMNAFNEAFSEHWGLQVMNEESWRNTFTGVPQFRSDLTYLAMDGETIVGFCVNWLNETPNAHDGWVEAIGVKPAWRGRGVASALLAHALQLFQDAGLEQAGLDVDAQNPTGALRLYKKHGFEIAKETIHFVKKLR